MILSLYQRWWLIPMNCLSWNCRGLGQSQAIRELTDLVNSKTSSIVFIMETCSTKKFLECLLCDLKQDNLFIVPRVNTRGGLALFWRNDIVLDVMNFSPNQIDVVVNPRVDDA